MALLMYKDGKRIPEVVGSSTCRESREERAIAREKIKNDIGYEALSQYKYNVKEAKVQTLYGDLSSSEDEKTSKNSKNPAKSRKKRSFVNFSLTSSSESDSESEFVVKEAQSARRKRRYSEKNSVNRITMSKVSERKRVCVSSSPEASEVEEDDEISIIFDSLTSGRKDNESVGKSSKQSRNRQHDETRPVQRKRSERKDPSSKTRKLRKETIRGDSGCSDEFLMRFDKSNREKEQKTAGRSSKKHSIESKTSSGNTENPTSEMSSEPKRKRKYTRKMKFVTNPAENPNSISLFDANIPLIEKKKVPRKPRKPKCVVNEKNKVREVALIEDGMVVPIEIDESGFQSGTHDFLNYTEADADLFNRENLNMTPEEIESIEPELDFLNLVLEEEENEDFENMIQVEDAQIPFDDWEQALQTIY